MESNPSILPADIEAVVALHHGGPVAVAGQQGEHVVMSIAALETSLAQAAAGETMSLDEAKKKLAEKYGS